MKWPLVAMSYPKTFTNYPPGKMWRVNILIGQYFFRAELKSPWAARSCTEATVILSSSQLYGDKLDYILYSQRTTIKLQSKSWESEEKEWNAKRISEIKLIFKCFQVPFRSNGGHHMAQKTPKPWIWFPECNVLIKM